MADIGVLLPVRIETRFKGGDLWVRVVPDEPWFLRDDPRISTDELLALRRYLAASRAPGPDGIPAAWRHLAGQVGAPRAVYLHRQFVTTAADGSLSVRPPGPHEVRTEPALPRVSGFPTELVVWLGDGHGFKEVLRLTVDRTRLLADFADAEDPGDRRWWEDWDEAVDVGMAGVVPASALTGPIDALYVTGLGDGDPAGHFAGLAAEGRIGLLEPGTPTNSVDGAPAAALAERRRHVVAHSPVPAGRRRRGRLMCAHGRCLPAGQHARRRATAAGASIGAGLSAVAGPVGVRRRPGIRHRRRHGPGPMGGQCHVPRRRLPHDPHRAAALRPPARHVLDRVASGRRRPVLRGAPHPGAVAAAAPARPKRAGPGYRRRPDHRRAAGPHRRHPDLQPVPLPAGLAARTVVARDGRLRPAAQLAHARPGMVGALPAGRRTGPETTTPLRHPRQFTPHRRAARRAPPGPARRPTQPAGRPGRRGLEQPVGVRQHRPAGNRRPEGVWRQPADPAGDPVTTTADR